MALDWCLERVNLVGENGSVIVLILHKHIDDRESLLLCFRICCRQSQGDSPVHFVIKRFEGGETDCCCVVDIACFQKELCSVSDWIETKFEVIPPAKVLSRILKRILIVTEWVQ